MQVESDRLTELPSLAHTQLVYLYLATPHLAALPPLPSILLQCAEACQEELEARFREAQSARGPDSAPPKHFMLGQWKLIQWSEQSLAQSWDGSEHSSDQYSTSQY